MWEMLKSAGVGMRLICPACRKGRIYKSFTRHHSRCPHCGVIFEREEGDFLGAMVVAYSIISVLVAAGIFITERVTDLTVVQHAWLWSVLAAAFLLLTYRNMKGIWIGILHAMVGLKGPREEE